MKVTVNVDKDALTRALVANPNHPGCIADLPEKWTSSLADFDLCNVVFQFLAELQVPFDVHYRPQEGVR